MTPEAVPASSSPLAALPSLPQASIASTQGANDVGITSLSTTEYTEKIERKASTNEEYLSPMALNIPKETSNTPTSPFSRSGGVDNAEIAQGAGPLRSSEKTEAEISEPKQRSYSTAIGNSDSFSTVTLSSKRHTVPGEAAGDSLPSACPSTESSNSPKIKESPESEKSVFLGQQPEGLSSGTQLDQLIEGSFAGQAEQNPEEIGFGSGLFVSDNIKSPSIERTDKSLAAIEQSPEGTHDAQKSQSSAPVALPSRGENLTRLPRPAPTFIDEEALNLDLLWSSGDDPEVPQAVDSSSPRYKAAVLSDTPPTSAGPAQNELETKAWLEANEANEGAATQAEGSREMTEDAKRLQEHVKALRHAGTQKVSHNIH
jgi:hypothetical protein